MRLHAGGGAGRGALAALVGGRLGDAAGAVALGLGGGVVHAEALEGAGVAVEVLAFGAARGLGGGGGRGGLGGGGGGGLPRAAGGFLFVLAHF